MQLFLLVAALFLLCAPSAALSKKAGLRRTNKRSAGPSAAFTAARKPLAPSLLSTGSSYGGGAFDGGGINNNNNLWLEATGSGDGGDKSLSGFWAPAVTVLAKLLASYSNLLTKHPYATKIVSSGFIGGLGDVLIQLYEGRAKGDAFAFDYRRLAVFTAVTAFYIAPVIHVWFNMLAAMPMPAGAGNVLKAALMMVADQTVGATVITVGFFYAFELSQKLFPPYSDLPLLSFLDAGLKSTKNNLWITMVANWYCWPIINFVNFLVVPIQFRVLFSNFAAVFWNMFLSSVANRAL